MNWGKYLITVFCVFVLRTSVNAGYYGYVAAEQFKELTKAHPAVFREEVAGYVGTDLLFMAIFVYLFARAGAAFGGGVGGGVQLGLIMGLVTGVVFNLYMFFGVTYMTPASVCQDAVYQMVTLMAQGALTGALYKAKA